MRSKRSRQTASEQRKSSTERCQPWRMIRCQALAASLARSLRYREKDPSGEQNQAVLRRGLSSSRHQARHVRVRRDLLLSVPCSV